MDPIEYELELMTRQAGRELANESQSVVDEIDDEIMGAVDDCSFQISVYLAQF